MNRIERFRRWLRAADKDDRYCYHRGSLACSSADHYVNEDGVKVLRKDRNLAKAARQTRLMRAEVQKAQAKGLVSLIQKKHAVGDYSYIAVAKLDRAQERKPDVKIQRNCMKCRRVFESDHIGNRMCERCK